MAATLITSGIVSSGPEKVFNISGTVSDVAEAPLVRKILCYRDGVDNEVHAQTDSTGGVFTLAVNGNANDTFRIVAVGEEGIDNSEIFDHIRGPA